MRRIGVFGGTFNPIHNGHMMIAGEVQKVLNLDKIIFIPAKTPPHKNCIEIADAKDRYNMVKLAVKDHDNFEVSDLEIKREGPSYSIDTVRELKDKFNDDYEFYFIIGSDTITELKQWRNFASLLKIIKFVVVNRPKYSFKGIPKSALRIQLRGIDVSSSKIRNHLKRKEDIKSLVPDSVEKYIIKKGLYRDEK